MIRYKFCTDAAFTDYKDQSTNYPVIKLTGLIMVKNQEKNIVPAIKSIESYCNQVVVVDTGSSDSTVEVLKTKFPKVKLHQIKWIENYSYMRNQCLKFVPDGWILVLDADEIFDETLVDKKDLLSFIAFVDKKYQNPVCAIKTKNIDSSAFVRKQILFKKTPCIKYHGIVHEEIVSTNSDEEITTIDTNLQVTNKGVNEEEIERFSKPKRYSHLLLKQIAEEPNNPRWVAMISQDYIELGYISADYYLKLLQKFIFKSKVDDFTSTNIITGKYLKYLLAKYAIFMLTNDRMKSAINCCKAGIYFFPYDVNFLTLYVSAKNHIETLENRKTLKFVLKSFSRYHSNLAKLDEESQGTQSSIDPPMVKLLMSMSEYDKAKDLACNITNKKLRSLICKELDVLNS